MNQALLQQLIAAQMQQQQQPKILLQFKAGKMNKDGKMVKPDTRKGKVVLFHEDGLLHIQWRERESNKVDGDLILFPGEAAWKRVEKVKDGRVYVLDYVNENRQYFFWLQEPKTDKDEENAKKINDLINNATDTASQQQSGLFNMISQQTPQRPQQRQTVQLDQLQNILQSVRPTPGSQTSSQQQPQQNQQQQQQSDVKLRDVLNSDLLCAAIRRNPDVVAHLIQYLPEGTPTDVDSICQHIRSPQFYQAVELFHQAMLSGELSGLMISLKLPPHVGSYLGGGVSSFVNAVQKQADEEKKEGGSGSGSGNNEKKDDNMDTSS